MEALRSLDLRQVLSVDVEGARGRSTASTINSRARDTKFGIFPPFSNVSSNLQPMGWPPYRQFSDSLVAIGLKTLKAYCHLPYLPSPFNLPYRRTGSRH